MTTTDARKRNTEPRDQGNDMSTTDSDRFDHIRDELTSIANLLDERLPKPTTYTVEVRTCPGAAGAASSDRGRAGTESDDEAAPDVDPDEARDDPEAWREVAKIMEERAEHYAAEAKANNEAALRRLADVERLTRERDEHERKRDEHLETARLWNQRYHAEQERADRLERERDRARDLLVTATFGRNVNACERYAALRAEVEATCHRWPITAGRILAPILRHDDERGRDA